MCGADDERSRYNGFMVVVMVVVVMVIIGRVR
jgi:hypothetical protein